MYIKSFLIIYTFIFGYLQCSYCTSDKGSGVNNIDYKYLFYEVNPAEGFNLRRDVYMRFASLFLDDNTSGLLRNWRLVLPPFHRLYHWKQSTKPLFWGEFFNISNMETTTPVVEIYEVFNKVKKDSYNVLEIDTMYILQNYKNAFDENGEFHDKWEFITHDECDYTGSYYGYRNITAKKTYCVHFQGKISLLIDIINQHEQDKKIMFVHGEIPLHENYGLQIYWDIRWSMKFHDKLLEAAGKFIKDTFSCATTKCNIYLSVHWRRGDFARSRKDLVPTIHGTASQIDIKLKKLQNIKKIFIATDAEIKEYKQLKNYLNEMGYEVHKFIPKVSDIGMYKEGGFAIIDQIICSRAAYFVGTHESTFTFRIQEERELLGYDSETTFNRLCPDKGKCERMSVWKALPASMDMKSKYL